MGGMISSKDLIKNRPLSAPLTSLSHFPSLRPRFPRLPTKPTVSTQMLVSGKVLIETKQTHLNNNFKKWVNKSQTLLPLPVLQNLVLIFHDVTLFWIPLWLNFIAVLHLTCYQLVSLSLWVLSSSPTQLSVIHVNSKYWSCRCSG